MSNSDLDAISAMFSEFSTKIADIEGKYEMLRERMLLSNESFLKTRDNVNKEVRILKDEIREIKDEIEKIKETIQHLLTETDNYARKEELRILERYIKIWEPLKFVKVDEVQKMIDDSLERLNSEKEEVKV